MKKITMIAALLLLSVSSMAQRYREIVMWEVETRASGILFGISETKDGADAVMYNFQKRNAGSSYDITSNPAKYKFTTVPIKHASDNPAAKIKSQMGGKSYKILPKSVIKDFEKAKTKGTSAMIAFYLDTKNTNRTVATTTNSRQINNTNKSINKKVVLWQVETRIDGLLFGISETKDDADAIMADFQKRNANTIYDISRYPAKYKFTTIPVNNVNEDPVAIFKSLTKKGKDYKVLSAEDIKGIEITKRKGIDAGVDYYVDVRGADRDFVMNRLKDILNNFDKYRIQSANSRFIASSVE